MSSGSSSGGGGGGGNGGGSGGGGGGGSGGGGPCGACKFLRRKCIKGCIFAPYFDSEQGATHFAAVHKVFGASNVSKLLQRIPIHKRLDAVVTICYEALARIRDPVYGCVGHIFALQQQVVNLQAELAFVQAHLSTLEVPASSHHQAAAMSLPHHHHQSLAAMVPNNIIHASSTNNIALPNTTTTNGVSSTEFMSSLQSQHNLDEVAAASCCSPNTDHQQQQPQPQQQQQQQQQHIDDGELQALAREFVSRYFPDMKFQTSSSSC